VWAFALLSAGLGLFQLLRAGALHAVLEYDDGVWFGTAVRLADGALPYRDFVLDQPPGVPLLLSPVALLSHVVGTSAALGVARCVTVGVQALNVVLVGRLLRHRSALGMAVACAVVAVFPAAVITSRTVMLEPYCDLWCLIGLLAAFEDGHLATGPTGARRALLAGAAFGVAGTCKAFAVLPFVVLLAQMVLSPSGAGGRRRTSLCLAAAAGCFALVCAPFVTLAPSGFFDQVVLTQLERGARAMPSVWARLAQLLGVPPAPSMSGAPDLFEKCVVVVVAILVGLALVAAWRAGRPPARSSVERYGVVAVLVTAAGLIWPAAFYYHYAAFLAPFLGLALGVAADRSLTAPLVNDPLVDDPLVKGGLVKGGLVSGRRRAVALGAAAVLVVVGTTHAVRAVQTTDQPGHPDVAWLARGVPAGACAITDNPTVLLLADRFAAAPGCSDLVDADGSTLAWAGGRRGAATLSRPQAIANWLAALRQTDYIVVTQGLRPARIPWGTVVLGYLYGRFREAGARPGLVVWARRPA
jgi:hypothetical protein